VQNGCNCTFFAVTTLLHKENLWHVIYNLLTHITFRWFSLGYQNLSFFMLWKAFKYTEKSQKVIFEKNVSYNPFALSPRYILYLYIFDVMHDTYQALWRDRRPDDSWVWFIHGVDVASKDVWTVQIWPKGNCAIWKLQTSSL